MVRTGFVMHHPRLLAALDGLDVWGRDAARGDVYPDLSSLESAADAGFYDLLIVDADLADPAGAARLAGMKGRVFRHLAFCGAEKDFEAARTGIRLGIDDYFVLPFSAGEFLALFGRIRAEESGGPAAGDPVVGDPAGDLVTLFQRRETKIYGYVDRLCLAGSFSAAAEEAVKVLFRENDWLDLYLDEEDYLASRSAGIGGQREKFVSLFESFVMLNPPHGAPIDGIVRYILYNPESDLRQKILSEEQHINKSYLSTVFTAQTGLRFVDYVTRVKLMRAAWLLRNTGMKIGEIAGRMDYKDIAYFSRQFKKTFHLTPSEYRIPDSYQFQI